MVYFIPKKGDKAMKPTEEEVLSALRIILTDKKSYATSLNYAVNYVVQGLKLKGEALRVQCIYVLNNIQKWRHSEAKEVRKVLKEFTKWRADLINQ